MAGTEKLDDEYRFPSFVGTGRHADADIAIFRLHDIAAVRGRGKPRVHQ